MHTFNFLYKSPPHIPSNMCPFQLYLTLFRYWGPYVLKCGSIHWSTGILLVVTCWEKNDSSLLTQQLFTAHSFCPPPRDSPLHHTKYIHRQTISASLCRPGSFHHPSEEQASMHRGTWKKKWKENETGKRTIWWIQWVEAAEYPKGLYAPLQLCWKDITELFSCQECFCFYSIPSLLPSCSSEYFFFLTLFKLTSSHIVTPCKWGKE